MTWSPVLFVIAIFQELVETSSEIARLTLSTPKKKKKWVLFEDQERGVGGEHDDPVNLGSLGRDHVRKQVLQVYEGVDGTGLGGLVDGENKEGSFLITKEKIENLGTNEDWLEAQQLQRSPVCWDGAINDHDSSAEDKVFFLIPNTIRGFKY